MTDELGPMRPWLDHLWHQESGLCLARASRGQFLIASVLAYTRAKRRRLHSYAGLLQSVRHFSGLSYFIQVLGFLDIYL